jgi:hypothetical protein
LRVFESKDLVQDYTFRKQHGCAYSFERRNAAHPETTLPSTRQPSLGHFLEKNLPYAGWVYQTNPMASLFHRVLAFFSREAATPGVRERSN